MMSGRIPSVWSGHDVQQDRRSRRLYTTRHHRLSYHGLTTGDGDVCYTPSIYTWYVVAILPPFNIAILSTRQCVSLPQVASTLINQKPRKEKTTEEGTKRSPLRTNPPFIVMLLTVLAPNETPSRDKLNTHFSSQPGCYFYCI